jgi:predicted dehydrogenase
VIGATLTAQLAPVANVHAAGGDTIRIGLIGCGGRGTGAARQALLADKNIKLVALGDAFADRLQSSLATLKKSEDLDGKINVKPDHCFVGFDAYKHILASDVDVVLLTTPPHFRPIHLKAAVEAGKHVFAEKPVAVDGPGVRSVLATCAEAKKKGLAIGSGLCWRYHHGMREIFKHVHEGAIGDITALQCTYNTGALWHKPRQPDWSDMEWQLRNWLYFTWLSGDFNVEQHVHSLDKMAWAMKNEYPVKASGSGGRQVRTGPEFGHIYDHHTVVYEFKNGLKLFSACRQQEGCAHDVSDNIFGTEGTCNIDASHARGSIKPLKAGRSAWYYRPAADQRDDMYQNEHDELFASIRAGTPINDGEYMTKSTLMAIMGRMATYTGQVIYWDKALNSKEDLTPPRYEFTSLPTTPVAMPGVTKFV